MRRMKKMLAGFLAVCLVFGTCGSDVLAADMTGNHNVQMEETETGASDVTQTDGKTENDGSEEDAGGTENTGSEEGSGGAENNGSEEEGGGAEDSGSEEGTDGAENGGSEEEGDAENTDSEETDGTGSTDPDEETDEGEKDTAEDEADKDVPDISEDDESVSDNSLTISENSIPVYNAASAETEGNFSYTLDEKTNTVTINGYADGALSMETLYIPSEIGGSPVTMIKASAFAKDLMLKTVVIPDSVTEMGANVFKDCSNLSDVTLSKGLVKTGGNVFQNCTSLAAIEIPKSLEGCTSGIFTGCTALTKVTFENGVTRIADHLFQNCPGITAISIPNTVTIIESDAFDGCSGLAEVSIPNSVAEISGAAFRDCSALTEMVMPDSITTVGNNAFSGCTSLSNVVLSKHITSLGYRAFYNCDGIAAIEIPKSLKKTEPSLEGGRGAFYDCDGLKNVSFENGTTIIAQNLFANCSGLESIVIPDTVTKIDIYAFYKCSNLVEVSIPGSVIEIGGTAFSECTSLTELVIPNSVTTIGRNAFSSCAKLEKVNLPNRLTNIGYRAFYDCNALTEIEIPKSLETTEVTLEGNGGVFINCTGLKTIRFEEGTSKIPLFLFAHCSGLEEIVIPDTVNKIERCAFFDCSNLVKVTIPDGVTEIGNSAFKDCVSLTGIVLPDSVVSIGTSVFENCSALSEATLSQQMTTIPTGLFRKSGIRTIEIPTAVTAIEASAFQECASLSEIKLSGQLKSIGASAFRDCTALAEVTLPDSIQTIGNYAFNNCDALTAITIPDSVTSLGNYIFAECELLKDVTLGTGITTIPSYAFNLCPSLEKIVLPYCITTINANAFTNCTSLTEVTIPRVTKTIANNAFSYFDRLTIYGVSGTYAETYADSVGAKFVNSEKNATEVRLNTTELKLANGKKTKLILSVTPSDFTDEVSWKSSAEDVVAVENTGEITAKKLGTATIKVTVGRFSASCIVTVTQPVTSINLNPSSLSLEAGDTKKLTATVLPDTAENKEIAWSTSDDRIASVDAQGTVTAHLKGTATITATAQDGSGVSRSCSVEVKNNGYICNSIDELESPHDYPNNCSDYWLYTKAGAESLYVTFDARTEVEENFDFITIFDGGKKQIDKYTGTQLAGETVEVPGDTVRIQLVSDAQASAWGFKVTRVMGTGNVENDEYQVTFDTRGGMMISPVTVEKGAVLARPETPVKPGYQFIGWYLDGVLYDFTQPVTGNLVLVARWEIDMTGVGPVVDASIPEEDMPADGIIPEGLWIAGVKDQVYTGKAHKPEVRVYDGAVRLTEKTDYTISYKNNVKANDASDQKTAPTITVKGKGNYKGSATAVYKIAPVDLNDESIFISDLTLAHNGQLQKKAPTVTYGGKKLAANRDYTVTYPDTAGGAYTEVGTYTVEVTGKGNFAGTQKIDLVITDKTPIEKAKFVKIANKAYNDGNPVELSSSELVLYMKSKNEPLTEGTDYKVVRYDANKEIGTATVIIAGMGDYAGTKRITFKIVGTPINKATVEGVGNKIYNGTEQTLDLTVKVNGTKLTLGEDYTVAYNKNENVGTASVTIQGINGYSGTVKKTFKITAYDLEKDEQNLITDTMAHLTVKYVKGGCKPQITVKFGETELVSGTDYTVTYQNNQNIAEASATKAPTVKIKGKGNFKGTRIGKFSIVKKNFNDPECPVSISVADVAYAKGNGKYVSKPVLTDTDGKVLKAGTDYDVTYTLADGITKLDKKSTVAAGSYVCVTAKGKGKYEGALLAAYRITKANFAKASIKIAPQTYTGRSIYLTGGDGGDITVKIGRDQLVYGVDYEILEDSYTNNIKKGNAGVKIRGLGDYGGTKAVKFKIQPKEMQSFGSIVRALLFGTE